MFFTIHSIIPMVVGGAVLLLAKRIASFILSFSEDCWLTAPRFRNLLYVWPIRFVGIICLTFSFFIAASGPSRWLVRKDENRTVLLESGKTTQGEVTKKFYQFIAPSGWKIIYKFNALNLKTNDEKTFWGSAQGPKKYYTGLTAGHTVDVIYNPLNPQINCEIKYFLNNPSFRHTFEKSGKWKLLDKYKDKYEIEQYSFNEWYNQQRQK